MRRYNNNYGRVPTHNNTYYRNNGYMKSYSNGSTVNVYKDRYGNQHREYFNAGNGYCEHTVSYNNGSYNNGYNDRYKK